MHLRSRFAVNVEIEDGEEALQHASQRFLLLLAARLIEVAARWNDKEPPATTDGR